MKQNSYLAAVVQAAPCFLDIDAGIEKAGNLIAEAAANGAKLIAFPEVWLPGYPWWIWTDSPATGTRFVRKHFENSMEVGDDNFNRLLKFAAQYDIHVVMGYSEKGAGTLYLSQAIIDNKGTLLSNRRKVKPTHVERCVYGEGDGTDLIVVNSELGRLGALNCAEHLQPLSKYAMYSQNEQVHVASWPSFSVYPGMASQLSTEMCQAASMTYALEGQSFVLAPSAIVSEEMLNQLVNTPEKAELLKAGGGYSMIYGPDGSKLCSPLAPNEEGILYATIDLGSIGLAKATLDPVGHYARADVVQLILNRKPRNPMIIINDESKKDNSESSNYAASELNEKTTGGEL